MSQPDHDEDLAAGEFLRHFLAERDIACPGCGYNLRGLTGRICPECGQALVVSLRLREPKQASLIAGIVGLSMGAGLGGLLLIYLLIVTFVLRQRGGPTANFAFINGAGFAIHGAAILAWVYWWNSIRRMSASSRMLLVIGCWTLPLVFVFVFALNIK